MTETKTKVRYLLLDTSMQYEVEGVSAVAVVPVTQALLNKLARLIQGMTEWKLNEPDVYETYFWCGMVEYYKYGLLDELQLDVPPSEGVILPAGTRLNPFEYLLRPMECHQLLIRLPPGINDEKPAEIEWYAIPKHGSHPLTTNEVTLARLQAVFDS